MEDIYIKGPAPIDHGAGDIAPFSHRIGADDIMTVVDVLHSIVGIQVFGSLYTAMTVVALFVCAIVVSALAFSLHKPKTPFGDTLLSYARFAYASFLKPYEKPRDGSLNQQHSLESFYRSQVCVEQVGLCTQLTTCKASVYDTTRKRLLRGREDMLGLVAAQLKYRMSKHGLSQPIWVDVGVLGST